MLTRKHTDITIKSKWFYFYLINKLLDTKIVTVRTEIKTL